MLIYANTVNMYRRLWLLSACSYNSKLQGSMRLINYVHLYSGSHTQFLINAHSFGTAEMACVNKKALISICAQ